MTLATWERVQATIQKTSRVEAQRWEDTHLLKGKLRTFEGYAMSPSSVQRRRSKNAATGRTLAEARG